LLKISLFAILIINFMTKKEIPYHIAIIMDGNRRWAKKRNLPSFRGHREGYFNFKRIGEKCLKMGIKILTVYAFSLENWKRSEKEISFLMKLFGRALKNGGDFFKKNNIRLNVIGEIERLPLNLKKIVKRLMIETKNNTAGIFNLALSYSGREEILGAVRKIIAVKTPAKKINEEFFEKYLYTAGQPAPDLLIRTGREKRLSGFLPWQSVYTELYFSDKFWPEFTEKDLENAIKDFQSRQRRFGR
jgi:undecaprenyl diphosphate synthase